MGIDTKVHPGFLIHKANLALQQPVNLLPLSVFRIVFGLLMFVSTIRFMWNGWIDEFYIKPTFHFTYYGFAWVKPLPGLWLYGVYGLVALLALFIAVGFYYRVSMIGFFLLFTYTELLDKTYYLNHYYFISILSFLLIFLPLHQTYSLDSYRKLSLNLNQVPYWTIFVIQLQLALVYFFAGVAKLKYDWLFQALPLKIWLAGHTTFPLIGGLFDEIWFAFVMSWGGALYDLTIPFLLFYRKTRPLAYFAVIGFHSMTAMLFNIGMFPYIMIACTLIFFTAEEWWLYGQAVKRFLYFIMKPFNLDFKSRFSNKPFFRIENLNIFRWYNSLVGRSGSKEQSHLKGISFGSTLKTVRLFMLTIFFTLQLLLPFRHWLYPGDVLWTEEGYRFAWNVMLAEKTGHVTFTLTNPQTKQTWTVYPNEYLTYQQEKQMSFQPDMILQFAHYLDEQYPNIDMEIRTEAYVSVNGRASQLLIDPTVDLTAMVDGWQAKSWVLQASFDPIDEQTYF